VEIRYNELSFDIPDESFTDAVVQKLLRGYKCDYIPDRLQRVMTPDHVEFAAALYGYRPIIADKRLLLEMGESNEDNTPAVFVHKIRSNRKKSARSAM
jgi:hypothetical protein